MASPSEAQRPTHRGSQADAAGVLVKDEDALRLVAGVIGVVALCPEEQAGGARSVKGLGRC